MDLKFPIEPNTLQLEVTSCEPPVPSQHKTQATPQLGTESALPQAVNPDDYLAWPHWSTLAPLMLLLSNWLLLIWLASHLDSLFAQLVLLPLCMVGVAMAWGWHRD